MPGVVKLMPPCHVISLGSGVRRRSDFYLLTALFRMNPTFKKIYVGDTIVHAVSKPENMMRNEVWKALLRLHSVGSVPICRTTIFHEFTATLC